jgi:hypothetical protein
MTAARTIAAMHDDQAGRRDLALAAVTVVGLSRLIEPPGIWIVAVFLLGYRAAALRVSSLRAALWSATTYAATIAIGAAVLRFIEIPRLMGPALLTLTFYLWDAFHAATPLHRRDARWVWQTLLLAVLGAVVVALNLLVRE